MFVHSLEWTRLPRGSVNQPHSREFRNDVAGAEMSSLVQHFAQNPTNLGSLPTVSGRGQVGEPGQGQFMIVELMGSPSRIDAAAFQTYSCPNAIAGWETMIGRDFETDKPLGFRALSHRGFNASKPPKDIDLERVHIVKEFMELWADSLHSGGIPRDKLYCHIAFMSQGLDSKEKSETTSHFSPPEIAFSTSYRPGFSTYPEGATFKAIYTAIAHHSSPKWISAEGTNVSPTGMPGESTMETYLAKMYNHGALMVNIYSWGIGGEANKNNFFRQATENSEALGAYRKFLRNETLVESVSTGFSAEKFQAKIHRIQNELPDWVRKSGQQATVMPLTVRLEALIKEGKFNEADTVVDQLLALLPSVKKN